MTLVRTRAATLLMLCALALAACDGDSASDGATATATSTAAASTARATSSSFAQAIRDVVGRVRPAVVQITNEQGQRGLFGGGEAIPAGVGSGVIYDAEGRILTNNHVVEGAQRLLVTLPDGRSFTATLLGTDPVTDLAVLQVQGDDLPRASLAEDGSVEAGDWVVAIGNALALEGGPTVTTGVVSALGRAIQAPAAGQSGGGYLLDLVQTDAAINPGNSGGPLLNLAGEVVGINTVVAGEAEGIGFAISTATIRRIARQLVEDGRAVHPYVGIRYVPLNAATAAELGTDVREGIAVGDVAQDSPAARAGLQARDIIVAVDGRDLTGESDFARAIEEGQPGDVLTFTVRRGGDEQEIRIELGEAPS
ncbi:MAG: trypsin-like peptidase domain-containing protein [Dehalococcoidia bacterium]